LGSSASDVELHEPADRHACRARGESDDRTPEHVEHAENVGPILEQPQRFITIRGKRRVPPRTPTIRKSLQFGEYARSAKNAARRPIAKLPLMLMMNVP
jgi:hypothetical protein